MLIEKTDHRISFYLTTELKNKVKANSAKYKVKPTDVYRTAITMLLDLNPEIGEVAAEHQQSLAEFINGLFEIWKLEVKEWDEEINQKEPTEEE